MKNDLIKNICKAGREKVKWLGWLSANYFLLVFVLVLCKIYFLVINRRFIAEESSWTLYLKSFFVGFRFDLSVAAYLHFVLLIALLICWIASCNKIWQQIQKKLLIITNTTLAVFYIVFLVVDTQFYHEFNLHLSFKDTDYLTSPELAGTIWVSYPIVLPSLVIIFLSWFYLKYSKIKILKLLDFEAKKSVLLLWLPLNFILSVGLLIICARGGIGLSNLNWGAAIFSSDPFANQLALNGLFSFGKSWDLEKDDDGNQVLQRMGVNYNDAVQIIRNQIDNTAQFNDSIHPLVRTTNTGLPETKKNVVVILLESWMAEYIGVLGSKMGITPNFDSLSTEGLFFTNFYAGGNRSNRGIVSVVTGYPSHYGKSIMKQISGQNQFYSLPGILKDRGYATSFIYGGDPEFDNMQGFLINNGVDFIIGQKDFPITEKTGKWGVGDECMFDRSIEYFKQTKQPFFSLLFTISNHEPFEAPEGFNRFSTKDSPEYKYLNTYYYSDYALGLYFKKIKNTEYYKNTIFVLVADHGRNRFTNFDLDPHRYHIPLLIINSGLPARIVRTTSGQADILPIVMGILGGSYTHASWGNDILNNLPEKPFYICQGDSYGLVKSDTLFIKDLTGNSALYRINYQNMNELIKLTDNTVNGYSKIADAYFALSYSVQKKGNYGKERAIK